MGWRETFRAARGLWEATDDALDRWAEIVTIRPRRGRSMYIELEIHEGPTPPFREWTTSEVPRGVSVEIGQHVAYRRWRHEDLSGFDIEWSSPPHYGSREKLDALRELYGDAASPARRHSLGQWEALPPEVRRRLGGAGITPPTDAS